MVRDLRARAIHCTSWGADWAAMNGHLDIVQDLRAHGIYLKQRSAVRYDHLSVLQDE